MAQMLAGHGDHEVCPVGCDELARDEPRLMTNQIDLEVACRPHGVLVNFRLATVGAR